MSEMTMEQFVSWRENQARDEEFSEEDGIHMYYTSGTTGKPKGVLLSHRIVMLHALGCIKGEARIPFNKWYSISSLQTQVQRKRNWTVLSA
jgi:acyl-coenzyme A synthetase/AMP-(fatty) acid ligase